MIIVLLGADDGLHCGVREGDKFSLPSKEGEVVSQQRKRAILGGFSVVGAFEAITWWRRRLYTCRHPHYVYRYIFTCI